MLYVNYISTELGKNFKCEKMEAYITKQKVGLQYVLVAKLYIFALV